MDNVLKNRYEISKVLIEDIWNLKIKDYTYELIGSKGLVTEYLIPFPNQQALVILFDLLKNRVSNFLVFETEDDKIRMFDDIIKDLSVLMEEQDRRNGSKSELHFKIQSLDNAGFTSQVKALEELQSENNQYKKAIAEQAIDYQKTIDKLDAEIQRLKELS